MDYIPIMAIHGSPIRTKLQKDEQEVIMKGITRRVALSEILCGWINGVRARGDIVRRLVRGRVSRGS